MNHAADARPLCIMNEQNRYLYVFGYCTPDQWVNNDARGWDDEDSAAFYIEADTGEGALAWGREVAEKLVRKLFAADARFPDPPSWAEAGFAHCIEHDPLSRFSRLDMERLQIVKTGEMPDLNL